MIYTVAANLTNPLYEAEWNDFYTHEKLPALISVRGFHTSQRFKALSTDCPVYLAVHSVDSLAVLQSDDYRHKGGGNFARWQPYITHWHRHLYSGLDRAPAIGKHDYLVISTIGAASLANLRLTPYPLRAVALETQPEQCWLATCAADKLDVASLPQGIQVYTPMTAQLTNND